MGPRQVDSRKRRRGRASKGRTLSPGITPVITYVVCPLLVSPLLHQEPPAFKEIRAPGGGGKYFRVVITYQDGGGVNERIEGDAIKVGQLATEDAPTVSGRVNVGGMLIVDAGAGAVRWQRKISQGEDEAVRMDPPGATGGDLTLISDYAGMTLRALVTCRDSDGRITAIVATPDQDIPGEHGLAILVHFTPARSS